MLRYKEGKKAKKREEGKKKKRFGGNTDRFSLCLCKER